MNDQTQKDKPLFLPTYLYLWDPFSLSSMACMATLKAYASHSLYFHACLQKLIFKNLVLK